ncbi:MAG: hypothetical protein E7404_00890 [Ruminococcaceae bacterium]|nr:hypothetical protein [Oscillospiraceae bacterium]
MIFKNAKIHNTQELIPHKDGSVTWCRIPQNVYDNLTTEPGKRAAVGSTGVEIRFVIKSGDSAKITLELLNDKPTRATFQVYYGGIQGGWAESETYGFFKPGINTFNIPKAEKMELVKRMTKDFNVDFDPEVVRVIFDRGNIRIIDIEGDIEPPKKEQLPKRTLLTYGSSITHGSTSIDAVHSWPYYVAHNLNMDIRNLGMAGSCAMEKEFADFIATEGEKGNWDVAILELGINVLHWEKDEIYDKAGGLIKEVALRNKDKKVFVISPFYCIADYNGEYRAQKWRDELKKFTDEENLPNVVYFDGCDILGDMSLITGDGVHPNIYGVQKIADRLTEKIKKYI